MLQSNFVFAEKTNSPKGWSKLTSTGYEPLALTFSGPPIITPIRASFLRMLVGLPTTNRQTPFDSPAA
jgi:hypothetical protein